MVGTSTVQQYPYLWDTKDPELDDALHNPDPVRDAALERTCNPFSSRGWINMSALVILLSALLMLFAGYPIIHYFTTTAPAKIGFNLGGINGSGQVPNIDVPKLIDSDTPKSAYSFTSKDGTKYSLVFSDEFETEGRTFWPGDDPFWEAVDMQYWPTGDLEWYTPTVSLPRCLCLFPRVTDVHAASHDGRWQAGNHNGRGREPQFELPERDAADLEQILLHDGLHRGESQSAGNPASARFLACDLDYG